MVDLSRVIVGFIVINQFVVWFLRVDYLVQPFAQNCLIRMTYLLIDETL
ncbi:hypothetical protein [uncultured Gammaproteobacteria bacterium]|nr:hypothetical protein [uncultured Gammaproteobacteria bacterium]CAC9653104.1 hypothetical protein [uncultured Gammaproteobacteria bacterium]